MSEIQDAALRERVARIEGKIDGFAPREWVREIIEPVAKASIKTEEAVTHLAGQFEALFTAHDKLLQERAQREREEHAAKLEHAREGPFLNLIKEKWAPIAGFVALLASLFAVIGGAIGWWIMNYVLPSAIK